MVSHYWWEGKIERAEEVVMIVKTRAALAEAVRRAVKELHTYTTPAIMVVPVESVDRGLSRLDRAKRRPNSIMPGARPGMTMRASCRQLPSVGRRAVDHGFELAILLAGGVPQISLHLLQIILAP